MESLGLIMPLSQHCQIKTENGFGAMFLGRKPQTVMVPYIQLYHTALLALCIFVTIF